MLGALLLLAGAGAAIFAVLIVVSMPHDITPGLVALVIISAILAWILLMIGVQIWRIGGKSKSRSTPGRVVPK